ncbi:hypothetical protein [Anabaena subtropica]|nr:hypothetical protein [Anabaena subtropica]
MMTRLSCYQKINYKFSAIALPIHYNLIIMVDKAIHLGSIE